MMLREPPETADVELTSKNSVITIVIQRQERLLEKYPRLGCIVAMNLVSGFSTKLRYTF